MILPRRLEPLVGLFSVFGAPIIKAMMPNAARRPARPTARASGPKNSMRMTSPAIATGSPTGPVRYSMVPAAPKENDHREAQAKK